MSDSGDNCSSDTKSADLKLIPKELESLRDLKLMVAPVWGHVFRITCPEGPFIGELIPVELSKTRTLTSQWCEKMATFFPQDNPKKEKYYSVVIDLKGFPQGSLSNISHFLSELSKLEISQYIPQLILENCTSYRFNNIFLGVCNFFSNVPHAEVRYYHAGIQYPCAAEKGLISLAALQRIADPASPSRAISVMEQLASEIRGITLDAHANGSSFDEITSNSELKFEAKTSSPVELLQKVVHYEEVDQELTYLKKRWDDLKGGSWPPLGIKAPDQIKQIYIRDLEDLKIDSFDSPIVLEVSGLIGEVERIIDFCWKTPSVRCLRIRDSTCIPASFLRFCDSQGESEDDVDDADSSKSLLLSDDRIRFLDVRTALAGGISYRSLPGCFKHRTKYKQQIFQNHFIWTSLESRRFSSLDSKAQKMHKVFDIFSEYLELLQLEFTQSSDGDAS